MLGKVHGNHRAQHRMMDTTWPLQPFTRLHCHSLATASTPRYHCHTWLQAVALRRQHNGPRPMGTRTTAVGHDEKTPITMG